MKERESERERGVRELRGRQRVREGGRREREREASKSICATRCHTVLVLHV